MRGLFYNPWGFIVTIICLVHFIRRRPNNTWLWIILIGGWVGGVVYIFVEIVPDLGLDQPFRRFFGLRKRLQEAEAMVQENPSSGNFEDLGMLLLDDKQYARARECYNRAITARTDHVDPFYRRALCAIAMLDYNDALPDLERVVKREPNYDFYRAPGLLAHAYAQCGRNEEAAALFAKTVEITTLSETQCYYAEFLIRQQRKQEARDWAQKVLLKKKTLPAFMRRRERDWFSKAEALMKQINA